MFAENLRTSRQLHRQRIVLSLSFMYYELHISRLKRTFGRVRNSIRTYSLREAPQMSCGFGLRKWMYNTIIS